MSNAGTKPTREHTLERIVSAMGNNFDEEKMHTALLLGFASSIYGTLRKDCRPNPIHRINFDEVNNQVSMDEMLGMSLPYEEGALDLSVVDEIFCANLRDIPTILEGETGVGKTFPATKYLSIVFQKDQYFSHRLSANAFLNNIFSHFQEGRMSKGGMPVIEAKVDKIKNCGAGMTDELNRGDSNETLQLFDNEMHCGGQIYKLGIPIPELQGGKISYSGKKKKLLLISAQNPAGTDDAKFTQTMQLDAAVENRLLKVYVGNAAAGVGSALWLGKGVKKPHEIFQESLSNFTSKHLDIDPGAFQDLKDDWLSVYSWTTEARRTDKRILNSSTELADLLIACFSGNLVDYYKYEQKVVKMIDQKLHKGVTIDDDLTETQTIKQIHDVTESFKIPVIFRDITQLKKISDVLSTLRNVKESIRSDDPVDTYVKMEKHVTIREVSGAMTLLSRNKQSKDAAIPIDAINSIMVQYVTLAQEYMREKKTLSTQGKFSIYDQHAGIKNVALTKSIKDTIRKSQDVDYLVDQIASHANDLIDKISASEDIKNVLIARSVGDLMTLCDFLNDYKTELDPIIKSFAGQNKVRPVLQKIDKFYQQKISDDAIVVPDIYQHRIERTLGI